MSTHFLGVDQLARSAHNLKLHFYYRWQVEPRKSWGQAKHSLEDSGELYMSTHFLGVDQLARSAHNLELHFYYRLQVEPRKSWVQAKYSLTMGRLGTVDDPEVLPYYMEAFENGYAGTRQSILRGVTEEEDTPLQASNEQQDDAGQEDTGKGQDEDTEGGPQEEQ